MSSEGFLLLLLVYSHTAIQPHTHIHTTTVDGRRHAVHKLHTVDGTQYAHRIRHMAHGLPRTCTMNSSTSILSHSYTGEVYALE